MHIQTQRIPFYRKKLFLWPVGTVVGLVAIVLIAFRVSPWPGALVIRAAFEDNGTKITQALQKHLPNKPITTLADLQYQKDDNNAYLDAYFPQGDANDKLPLIIWTHGGAWVGGDKNNAAPYFKLLASAGYTVIAPNYSLAPEASYPTPVHELNDAYAYIKDNSARLHADTDNIILAGDSAGSQLSAQMAALITNPTYANEVGIKPVLEASQLKGVILNCGIYKMEGLTQPDPTLPKIVGWGDDVTVWAYSGTKDFSDPVIRQMSAYYHVTSDFPATYISGGNADPLTDAQSKPLADKLQSLGVEVSARFYAANHQPALPHEYQFNLDNEDGKAALMATIEFVKTHTE